MPSHPQVNALTRRDVEAWLSPARLDTYLIPAHGNLELALRLYNWNSRLAAVALSDTCHLEVALRNAYDRALQRRFPDWAIDPSDALFSRTQGVQRAVAFQGRENAKSIAALAKAKEGLGAKPSHDKVVAALPFGFWTRLTEQGRTALFWNPLLSQAFPRGTQRASVHDLVARINKFRNRLAHNEPVFSSRTGLRDRMQDVDDLFALVAPQIGGFVRETSAVPRVVSACPVPGLF